MNIVNCLRASALRLGLVALVFVAVGRGQDQADAWQVQHDQLVARLQALKDKAGAFGAAYQPIYQAALPWYERWAGINREPVDAFMVNPEQYAGELASALEQGKNFIQENPGAQIPLVFEAILPGGEKVSAKYWLKIPAGFPSRTARFPLIIGLHGSGWLGHKISFVRGTGSGGPCFEVLPIDEKNPWRLDFLNAFLDRLQAMLPIDADRIYVEGHSLGGIATWLWAEENPERFAAISPRAGIGEPYRAIRLKNVPSWAIHGANDSSIPLGFAEQMVSALQICGAPARLSVLPGVEHNMPDDFDEPAVIDWYLHQTRSHQPPPVDPRDTLKIGPAGYSPWEIITVAAEQGWRAGPYAFAGLSFFDDNFRPAAKALFDLAHAHGSVVSSTFRSETNPVSGESMLWLAAPVRLRSSPDPDPALVTLPARRFARFYFRGASAQAFRHALVLTEELKAAGYTRANDKLWITGLSFTQNTPDSIAEYWIEIR